MIHTSARRNYPVNDERFQDGETFLWERLRPRVRLKSPWLETLVEGQDTHAIGSAFTVRKAWLDLLNAHVTTKPVHGLEFRLGRQQGDFEVLARMVRTSDFAAVIRSFDIAELGWRRKRTDVRAFYFLPVDNLPSRFNRHKRGEKLWTTFAKTVVRRTVLQSYVIARHNESVTDESGVSGSSAVYAWETFASGPTGLPKLDWTVETVLERGHWSTDDVRAWAVFLRGAYFPSKSLDLDVRFSATSSDRQKGDGIRGTYDTFYEPASSYGSVGLLKGSNLRQLSVGGGAKLTPSLDLRWRAYANVIGSRADALYGSVVGNTFHPDATSRHVGEELDVYAYYRVTPKLQVRGAVLKFFPGRYFGTNIGAGPYELRLQIIGEL